MTKTAPLPLGIATVVFTVVACSTTDAAVLMFDVGGTSAIGNPANSPYHSVNGSFTDTTWNTQGKSSDNTIFWSDGTTATGVVLTTLKNASAGLTAMSSAGWSSNSSDINGSQVNTGIYSDNSVGVDGYMMTVTFTNHRAIGVQLSGLAAGTYDIYVSGRNTNYTSAYTTNFYAAAGNVAGAFDFAAYASQSTSFTTSATDKVSAWQFTAGDAAASNYVKLTVTLSNTDPYLNLATIGNDTNGVFSSIQVVAVPEPASVGLVAALGLIARRRRV